MHNCWIRILSYGLCILPGENFRGMKPEAAFWGGGGKGLFDCTLLLLVVEISFSWCSSQLACPGGVWDAPPNNRVHHLHSPAAITRNFGRGVGPADLWLLLGSTWLSPPVGTHHMWLCPSSQCCPCPAGTGHATISAGDGEC